MTGKRGKPHHAGTYGRDAAQVRAQAYANPTTQCWRCHRTLDQIPPHRTGRAPRWTSGHVIDGQVGGAMLPECSVCATSTGAARGNRLREPHSERWY